MKKLQKRIYFFIGTVAEFGKLTPVFKELQRRNIHFDIIDSGQNVVNYGDFKKYLGDIAPVLTINKKVNKSSTIIFFFWALTTLLKGIFKLRKLFAGLNKQNSYFIIHGDTVTSTIGAVIAKILGLKLIHIEAGYFSNNYLEPFPEEICKHINSLLADVMFAPTDWALQNIRNFKGEKISTNFNTNIESFWWAFNQKTKSLPGFQSRKYYILIVHRQEHILFKREWTKKMMEFVITQADKNLDCVLLNHPLTVQIIKSLELGSRAKKIKIVSHIAYPQFLKLLKGAEFIATDSATIQQEAFYIGKPYLGLADFAVQTEGLGENAIFYKSDKKVIKQFLGNYKNFRRGSIHPKKSPAKIIVDYLIKN